MALQCNAELRLLIGLLSILFFDLSFQFLILHLLISLCPQFNHLFIRRGYRWHSENLWNLFLIIDMHEALRYLRIYITVSSFRRTFEVTNPQ